MPSNINKLLIKNICSNVYCLKADTIVINDIKVECGQISIRDQKECKYCSYTNKININLLINQDNTEVETKDITSGVISIEIPSINITHIFKDISKIDIYFEEHIQNNDKILFYDIDNFFGLEDKEKTILCSIVKSGIVIDNGELLESKLYAPLIITEEAVILNSNVAIKYDSLEDEQGNILKNKKDKQINIIKTIL